MGLSGLPRAGRDTYVLRGLLHCDPCGQLMIPTCTSTGGRYYGCPHRDCPRMLVPADRTEARVWQEYVRGAADAAGTPEPGRHELLVAALRRVTVGAAPDDLHYHWRPGRGGAHTTE
ncbi:hypothetical protein SAMN05444365_10945 [Micromonospora pattaloongensis]|uniref:Recombinase zinc beta ribbon domain-containing protein n=1 Tax=Micromonospora pattaloongensis TaxID=405436 RepID=A0A1H3RS63_9ACTN|nr:zinc ribbon domain-containing protein [Micromonospora pattaloongensis]SDZ28614.1 hypothetical protein SAMN05444365_10945 [Micromonospora pattaloongensis]